MDNPIYSIQRETRIVRESDYQDYNGTAALFML